MARGTGNTPGYTKRIIDTEVRTIEQANDALMALNEMPWSY